jgi:hypothetical protein
MADVLGAFGGRDLPSVQLRFQPEDNERRTTFLTALFRLRHHRLALFGLLPLKSREIAIGRTNSPGHAGGHSWAFARGKAYSIQILFERTEREGSGCNRNASVVVRGLLDLPEGLLLDAITSGGQASVEHVQKSEGPPARPETRMQTAPEASRVKARLDQSSSSPQIDCFF